MDVTDLRGRVEEIFPGLVDDLADLVRIPSVSAAPSPSPEVERCAEAVADKARAAGFPEVEILRVEGAHPSVFAQIPAPPGAPTVLLYAHHDVQPPGPEEDWEVGPWQPQVKNGRLYGRGAADDKAGIVMHLGAVRLLGGEPPVGVKLLVEGEEEVGSAHLGDFLDRYAPRLAADVIVIGDAGNWRVGQPALTTSLRGLVAVTVEVRTARQGVHSGQFGGVFPDALTVLCRLLATLHDDRGNVAVEGLEGYETDPLDLTEEELRAQVGAVPGLETIGEGNLTSRLWTKPALSVLAIDAPRIDQAINQLVPVARAKVSLRIPPGQDPDDAANALRRHLLRNAPWGADVTVFHTEKGAAFRMETEGPVYRVWREAMEASWGVPPVEIGAGGSIPFVADFATRYPGAPILLVGCADPTSGIHGPNESQSLDDLRRGVLAEAIALARLA
jgi:acetylornithine deacetylase/succinyl-diaminopimelate desuccinylase-like protein